jgi:hypothetical protein
MPTQGAIVNPSISTKFFAATALAVAALGAASAAHARSDVYISVGVQGAPVYTQPVPVYEPAPVYRHYPQHPAHYDPHYRSYQYPRHYRQPTHWDHDGDGIPNRRDPVYNPRWDVDGDGIPNRHDPVYNPRWHRDRDVVPNGHDRNDDRYWRGR